MDLRSFREDKLKIKTQAQFAELIGVEQSSISRWEKEPDNIPFQIIQRIMEKTGASFEELTGWRKPIPEPLNVDDTWKQVDFTKMTLSDYITTALEKIELPDDLKKSYIDDLNTGIIANLVKPKVAIVGRSDTGKSTLINALLGAEKMPTAWTPTTSIAVYLKHISDRPSFIEEDVWMFANSNGDENMWDERKLNDEEYCRSWKIAAGGVEILRSYGTRQGNNYDKSAGSAVVFIDAPILNTCDIVDLPGFGTETESDDNITFATSQRADVIIYMSQANGFMRIEDILYLKRNISMLPIWEKNGSNCLEPLSNLFIVASQAHTVENGNRVQLKEILDTGCKNLLKTIPDKYWDDRAQLSGFTYSENGYGELRSRFFTYTTDIIDLCQPFNESLKSILEILPQIINERTKVFVKEYVTSRKPNLIAEIEKYQGIVDERDKYESLLKEIDSNELQRVQENDARKKEIRESIEKLRTESLNEFTDYIANTVNTDAIVSLMNDRGIKNKKESIEQFGSYFTSIIQEKCESILAEKSEMLSKTTVKYINEFSNSIGVGFSNNGMKLDFDAGWAFASALSKIGLIGGFGAFLATSFSTVITLTSIGLSLGSAVTVAALIPSLFGPIGMAAGLVVLAGLGLVKLFGGGWQKSVAKKLVAGFEEERITENYRSGINEFWKQTSEAFEKAAAELDEEWNGYVSNLRETVNSYDIADIQNRIATLKNISCFFENIPL